MWRNIVLLLILVFIFGGATTCVTIYNAKDSAAIQVDKKTDITDENSSEGLHIGRGSGDVKTDTTQIDKK